MVNRLLWLQLLGLATVQTLGACAPGGSLAANGVEFLPRASAVSAPEKAVSTTLRLNVGAPGRQRHLTALPGAWDRARVTFSSPTALTAPIVANIQDNQFTFVNPYYEYTGSALPVLRPATDYTISADVETDAPQTLEAYGAAAGFQSITAGPNTFSLTLAVTGVLGSETTVDTGAGMQSAPAVAYDLTANQFLVVWTTGGDIWARRFTAAGVAAGAPTQLNTSAGTAGAPVAAYNATAAKYLVAWQDSRNGHSDIFARSIDSADVLGGEVAVTHTGGHSANETQPAIASAAGADRFLIAWTDDRTLGSSALDVYAARVDSDVTSSGEILIAGPGGVTNQSRPAIAYAANLDKFFIVTEDDSTGDVNLRFQRVLASTGVVQDGTAGGALSVAAGDQDQAAVIYNPADGVLFTAWRDSRGGANTDIYYTITSPSTGGIVQPETALFFSGDIKSLPHPCFSNVHRDYMIAFSDNRNGDLDVFVRRLKRDGVTAYGEKPIVTGAGDARLGGMAFGQTSDVLFSAWEDDRAGGANTDIYGQVLR